MLAALTALMVLLGCFGLAALSVGFAVAVGIAKFAPRLAFCASFRSACRLGHPVFIG